MNNRHVCLILLAAGALPGQSPSPIFKTDAKLVQVDVVVRDKNGPVSGLTKQDFTLLDNGKPQEIAVFSVKGRFNPRPRPSSRIPPFRFLPALYRIARTARATRLARRRSSSSIKKTSL
jgi:VWFA-related protein